MSATLAIIIAAISFSFYPLLYTFAMEGTSNYLIALIVQVISPLFCFALLAYQLKSVKKSVDVVGHFFRLPWEIQIIPFLSGTGILVGTLFFIFALEMMSKAGATLIMECWPLLAIIVARAMLTDKHWDDFKPLDFILIIITLLGLALISASEAKLSFEEFLTSPSQMITSMEMTELYGILLAILSALCFAWGSVSRSYFASLLPHDMRIKYFGKINSIAEANYTYMLAYAFGIPMALFCFIAFEGPSPDFSVVSTIPILLIANSLIIVAVLYAYAITVASNANINLLWYLAPVLATIWLVLFGYSEITPLLLAGGFLIILANLILILANKKDGKEVLLK